MTDIVSFPGLGLEIPVNNIALQFTISGSKITIYWYGVVIALGFAVAIIYAMMSAKRFELDRGRMVDVIIGGTIGAIICARLYYVIFSWSNYKDDFWAIFKIWEGGLAIYGAVIGALLGGFLACRLRKVNFKDMIDVAGIGFLIGQAFGRWGNFFNQEAFGCNTTLPWGMTSSKISAELTVKASELAGRGILVDPSVPVHPCFFYESLWCLIGVFVLYAISRKRKFKGQIFISYMIWYGIGRVFIEGLRTDSLMLGSLRVSQLLSAIIVIFGIILMVINIRRVKEKESMEILAAVASAEGVSPADELSKLIPEIEDDEDDEKAAKADNDGLESELGKIDDEDDDFTVK